MACGKKDKPECNNIQVLSYNNYNQNTIAMKTTDKSYEFEIGEYAIGGIIKVVLNDSQKIIGIVALDWNTKKVVPNTKKVFDYASEMDIDCHLNNLTTCYYTDKILAWIKKHYTFKYDSF